MRYLESFKKTTDLLNELYQELLKVDDTVKDLFTIVDSIESSQDGLWKHIDYGIRTPAFRHMQWIEYKVKCKCKGDCLIRTPLLEVNVHILKEYFQLWFTSLDKFSIIEDHLPKLLKNIAKKNELKYDEIEARSVSKELTSGISNELKASYVLTDHRKPFLPFSIMQAPVVPSIVRLVASGDLYLFEENLVVDVKRGWLNEIDELGKLPTYHYKEKSNLSIDLKKCKNIGNLFGIRKSIGVVAENNSDETIHFAVYVPWRLSRIHGPLFHLFSYKLPFLIYIHRKNYEIYVEKVRNNTLTVDLEAFVLSGSKEMWIDSSKWGIRIYSTEEYKTKKGERKKRLRQEIRNGKLEFSKVNKNLYGIRVEIPVRKEDRLEIKNDEKSSSREYFAFELVHKDKRLRIPVVVSTKER